MSSSMDSVGKPSIPPDPRIAASQDAKQGSLEAVKTQFETARKKIIEGQQLSKDNVDMPETASTQEARLAAMWTKTGDKVSTQGAALGALHHLQVAFKSIPPEK